MGRRACQGARQLTPCELWIKDLITLPFQFFKQIVQVLPRQGMKENYVSPVVLFYATNLVLSKKTHKFWATTAHGRSHQRRDRREQEGRCDPGGHDRAVGLLRCSRPIQQQCLRAVPNLWRSTAIVVLEATGVTA